MSKVTEDCFPSQEAIQAAARRAYIVFKWENWTYGLWSPRYPSVEDIEDTINHLVDNFKECPEIVRTSTGRIVVQRDDELEPGALEILLDLQNPEERYPQYYE